MIHEKKKDSVDQRKTLRTIVRMVCLYISLQWKRSKAYTVFLICMMAIPGLMRAMSLPALENFILSVEQAAGGAGIGVVWVAAGILCAVNLLEKGLEQATEYLRGVNSERVKRDITSMLMRKLSRKDPVMFENPEVLDCIEKAYDGVEVFDWFCHLLINEVAYAAMFIGATLVYLAQKSPILAGILVVSIAPIVLVQSKIQKQSELTEDELAPIRRAAEYCEKAAVDRDNFKETRLLGAFRYFHEKYSQHNDELAKKKRALLIRNKLLGTKSNVLSLVGFVAMLIVMLVEFKAGQIELAAFAAVLSSLLSVYTELVYLFDNTIWEASHRSPKVANYFKAIDLPEREGRAEKADGGEGVSLRNVHFRYPGAEQESVRGVTLDIAPRETIAVVGENGAGKTTLVRLLTGLYLPTEGSVRIGGKDTKEIDLPSATGNISAVFQKYMKYRLRLCENVRISEGGTMRDIAEPLREAGLAEDSVCFPEKGQTMLSREFGGVDLSGGQWQRVAIARGLYRSHEMIVLDEPTAAIDPLEETRVYKKFAELSRDKTAVIVTHRMGSARIADRIVVMKDGVIEDVGSHDALMRRGGEYARMVNAQAAWYETEDNPT